MQSADGGTLDLSIGTSRFPLPSKAATALRKGASNAGDARLSATSIAASSPQALLFALAGAVGGPIVVHVPHDPSHVALAGVLAQPLVRAFGQAGGVDADAVADAVERAGADAVVLLSDPDPSGAALSEESLAAILAVTGPADATVVIDRSRASGRASEISFDEVIVVDDIACAGCAVAQLPAESTSIANAAAGTISALGVAPTAGSLDAAAAISNGGGATERHTELATSLIDARAGRLHKRLTDLGASCTPVAAGETVVADLSEHRGSLAEIGIQTSRELARHLSGIGLSVTPGDELGHSDHDLVFAASTARLDANSPQAAEASLAGWKDADKASTFITRKQPELKAALAAFKTFFDSLA